jgi:hypothetical protein
VAPLVWVGVKAGLQVGRTRAWWVLFGGAMAWLGLVIAGHRLPGWSLAAPVRWATDVTAGPLVMAFLVPAMFAALVPRLPVGRRAFVRVVTGIMVANYAVLPAACPLAVRGALAAGETKFDGQGVCLQTHPYTCGPSATVTCLRALGVSANEGPLAIAARCGPMVGTDARFLAETVNELFGGQGVRAECRYEKDLEAVRVPAVVAMDMPLIGGHFVAVLGVTGGDVLVGDPYSGRCRVGREQFMRMWTGITIELRREEARR